MVEQLKMKLVRNLIERGINVKTMKSWENNQNEMYNDFLEDSSDDIEDVFEPVLFNKNFTLQV